MTYTIYKVRNLTVRGIDDTEARGYHPAAEILIEVEGDEYVYAAYLTPSEATELARRLTPV